MQAKQTYYNGFKFRSRTEARWAVFFDSMGIKYLYEHEDFMLPSGRYLPDFYLPNYEYGKGTFAEIKGEFTQAEELKCRELCDLTGKQVLLLAGVPDFLSYDYYSKHERHFREDCPLNCLEKCSDTATYCAQPMNCQMKPRTVVEKVDGIISSDLTKYGNRMYVHPGFRSFEPDDWYDAYRDAVYAARSARFEFGETPNQ